MSTWKWPPFSQSAKELHTLIHHPEAVNFQSILRRASDHDRAFIARLWLTEGIPYAFSSLAGVYEEMRMFIADRLGADPKDVTLLGSGRIGFSMKPDFFGKPFGERSDLDLAVVNKNIFDECKADVESFVSDFSGGRLVPRNENERRFWLDNAKRLPKNIGLGFIDANKIPEHYRKANRVNNVAWRVLKRMECTEGAPVLKGASIRVYSDWGALVRRVSFNLQALKGG